MNIPAHISRVTFMCELFSGIYVSITFINFAFFVKLLANIALKQQLIIQ